jgi:hypothetical protein
VTYYTIKTRPIPGLFGVDMPEQLPSQLARLVRRDKRSEAALNASVTPTADSTALSDSSDNNDSDDKAFDGLDWARVPHFERRGKDHAKGQPSWIY